VFKCNRCADIKMSNPHQRPQSMMAPYGFVTFGPVGPMQV